MATDRRTKYTKSVIRQALFDLLKEKPLNKITVTDICKMPLDVLDIRSSIDLCVAV